MFTFSNGSKFVLCIAITALVTGCGSTAIISRASGSTVEGNIVGADKRTIYVETSGNTSPVARDQISDIDHPGNVAATLGIIVTGYGIANIAVGAENCERSGTAYCTGVFLPAAIGVPIMAYGLVTWLRSVNAAGPRNEKTASSITIVPTVSVDKKNEYVGVSAAMRF